MRAPILSGHVPLLLYQETCMENLKEFKDGLRRANRANYAGPPLPGIQVIMACCKSLIRRFQSFKPQGRSQRASPLQLPWRRACGFCHSRVGNGDFFCERGTVASWQPLQQDQGFEDAHHQEQGFIGCERMDGVSGLWDWIRSGGNYKQSTSKTLPP